MTPEQATTTCCLNGLGMDELNGMIESVLPTDLAVRAPGREEPGRRHLSMMQAAAGWNDLGQA